MEEKLIKSKHRVQKHGEVFTPSWMVQKMLDTPGVKEACENVSTTFLEPAAGDGNFLLAILERKLQAVADQYDERNWKTKSLIALSSIYGIEFLEDNLEVARSRMFLYYLDWYEKHFGERLSSKSDIYQSAHYLIHKNIIRGNKCQMDDVKQFRKLFNFCFIKASRPLDDDSSDHAHSISKQMIKMAKLNEDWNELIDRLPDEILKPIQDKGINKKVQETSLTSLKETIAAIEKTNGGQSGDLMLDMHVTEEDISDLLQRITTATYCVDGYFLGEESQGLGYSNMIYIHLQLNEYENSKDDCKVNVFFVEEPESHMHPQMQQVFIKYLIDHYKEGIQGLITTHSNEMVRVAGLTHLRVIRKKDSFLSKLYDLSKLIRSLEESSDQDDKKLAEFYDWFFEIGYSELIFADKAIFYEGDTERLYIRKLLTLEKYKKLKQQYIAYIQVGGAYAKNYRKMIELLGIKSLIITDIDYSKNAETIDKIDNSKITNATIKDFYRIDNPESTPTVKDLYAWKEAKQNIINNGLIYTCFQTKDDGYARTLEEAMLAKYFSMDVSVLAAYRLFYVGCSRARKNLAIVIDNADVVDFKERLKNKFESIGFEIEENA